MANECACIGGRPCYNCSVAVGSKPIIEDEFFADTLGYD